MFNGNGHSLVRASAQSMLTPPRGGQGGGFNLILLLFMSVSKENKQKNLFESIGFLYTMVKRVSWIG